MSARLQECTVAANREVAPGHALVTLESGIGAAAEPGQFVQVSLDGVAGAFLPRPFSFHRAADDQFQLLLRSVGPGTAAIVATRPGERLTVLGPLGRGFELQRAIASGGSLTLVGGGVGVPPLHHVADFVRAGGAGSEVTGAKIDALVGAATAELLLAVDDLRAIDVDVRVSTDDGSAGHHGLVTELLHDELGAAGGADGRGRRPGCVLACGPHPMLRAVAKICRHSDVPCQVAMEEPMACGYGVCLGCAIPAAAAPDRYLLLCKDGPVFDAEQVAW